MTYAQFNLARAAGAATLLPMVFVAFHLIDGSRPLVTEFEAGGILAVVLVHLIDASHAFAREQR